MVHLITGYAGKPHVTSASDGALNAGIYGKGKYILNMGEKFAYEIISNNLIKIKSGFAINQGRKIEIAINDYEEVTIDNGLQGMKRCDLIVLRYEKNSDSGIETANLVAIKGTSTDAYAEPVYTEGDILTGKAVDDILLYKVFINGLSIENVESAFTLTDSLMDILAEQKRVSSGMGQQIATLSANVSNLGKSVADGKALLASTISAWGNPTASDATFEVLNTNMAAEFAATRDAAYSQGVAAADARENTGSYNWGCGWNAGVVAADGRAAPGTVNYQSGYNQGVADADGRANSNSANWQNGHSVGYQAGVAAELNAIAGAWTTHGTVTGRLYMYVVEHNDSGYIWNTCNMANLSWVPGNVNEVYGYGTDGIKVEIFCIDGAAVSLQDFDAWLYGRNAYPSGFPVWKIKHTWSWVL
jgi:hypothetical protein